MAQIMVDLLGLKGKLWVLAMDRTNWDFRKTTINIRMTTWLNANSASCPRHSPSATAAQCIESKPMGRERHGAEPLHDMFLTFV